MQTETSLSLLPSDLITIGWVCRVFVMDEYKGEGGWVDIGILHVVLLTLPVVQCALRFT